MADTCSKYVFIYQCHSCKENILKQERITGLDQALSWQDECHFGPIKLMFYLITGMIMLKCGPELFMRLYCTLYTVQKQ